MSSRSSFYETIARRQEPGVAIYLLDQKLHRIAKVFSQIPSKNHWPSMPELPLVNTSARFDKEKLWLTRMLYTMRSSLNRW